MTSKSMRNKMKKAFVCTLSAAVLMSSASVPAFAADEDVVISVEDAEENAEETETDEVEVEEDSTETADFETSEDAEPEEETVTDSDVEAFDDGTETEALTADENTNGKYKVSFKSFDGKHDVADAAADGIQMNIQDVPSYLNVGQLKVEGFDGKVAWLLSQYNDKTHVDTTESMIWPGLETGNLEVKGVGKATIIAWDAETLSHTVDKQDVPKADSVKLAEIKVTVTSEKVEALRLLANGKEIVNNKLAVDGSEWVEFTPQTKTVGSNEWKTVPVSSVQFPASTNDKNYEPLVTNTEAKYRARGFGKDFDLKVTGYDKTYTVHVSSSYVALKSIKPSVSGTVVVYPADYTKGDGSQNILGTVITRDVFNGSVEVTPANASYADRWTMTSSDEDVVEYNAGNGTVGIMPKKVGEAVLTVRSDDPFLAAQVSGSTTVKFVYADEVAVAEFNKVMAKLPAVDKITKANEETVKEAEFIYENMSSANKAAVSKDNVERLTNSRAKLNGNLKSEDGKTEIVKKPETTVKPEVKTNTATTTVKAQKKTVALKKLSAAVKKNWTVKKGKKVRLKVKKTPAKATGTVKWTSSNKKVATVSSKGVVKAKKKGTAVITAKIGNKKVKFKIKVK